jgi:hypothetical protein
MTSKSIKRLDHLLIPDLDAARRPTSTITAFESRLSSPPFSLDADETSKAPNKSVGPSFDKENKAICG